MSKAGIYRITNTASGRVYIGSSVNVMRRYRAHLSALKAHRHHSGKLQRAYDKHGDSSFVFEVIESVTDFATLAAREQHWIDLTQSAIRGYNILPTAYSMLGRKLTADQKANLSKKHMGKTMSPESRLRMSESKKALWAALSDQGVKVVGNQAGRKRTPEQKAAQRARCKANPPTDEMREKMSVASRAFWKKNRGLVVFTGEQRAKISEIGKGRVVSSESRKKQSDALLDYYAHNKRPEMTPEAREKIRQANLNRKASAETRQKMSDAKAGVPLSQEVKDRMSQAQKIRFQDPLEIEKLRKAQAGSAPSIEACRKGGAARSALPAEQKAEIYAVVSAKNKGLKRSPETKARMSESQKGRVVSDESRARMSAAAKARYARAALNRLLEEVDGSKE